MTLRELESAALKLSPTERAQLAAIPLSRLDELSDVDIERLWAIESQRRDDQLVAGTAKERPARDVFRDLRERLSML